MLVLLGANHRSAPLEFRERLALTEKELAETLQGLTALEDVDEALVLSTCNRVEVLASGPRADATLRAVQGYLSARRGVDADDLERQGYRYVGRDAVRHIFRVTSGLDSMILGEPQITGQVKRAHRLARQAGTTGAVLERLMQHALATAKRVRSETDIGRHPVSIASAAVVLARQIFGELEGRTVLLLGAGKMAALVATHLASGGVGRVTVTGRTYSRAQRLAERFGGQAVRWESALAELERSDIVISGTAAPGVVLTRSDVQLAVRGRRAGPLFVIDIAVPRDVEPAVNDLANVYLYDVDDLQGVVDHNLEGRRRAADQASQLVAEEVVTFVRWAQSLQVAPTIVALRETLLSLGEREVARFRGRLGSLTADQEAAVHELSRAIIQKILHRPIRRLKASTQNGEAFRLTELFQDVFGMQRAGLPGEGEPADERRREDGAPRPPTVKGTEDR